jgi:hypothetical protein
MRLILPVEVLHSRQVLKTQPLVNRIAHLGGLQDTGRVERSVRIESGMSVSIAQPGHVRQERS